MRHVRAVRFERPGSQIKRSSSQIRQISKRIERVAAIRMKNVPSHPGAQNHQHSDRQKAGQRAAPHPQKRVPSPGTSHPATPMTKAIVSLLEFSVATVAIVSSPIHLPFIRGSCQQRKNFVLNRPRYTRFGLADIYIHFTAHAELWKINSRLNRIAGAWNQMPHVLRFESVHIHTVAVHSFSDAVPRPVKEIFPVTSFL